ALARIGEHGDLFATVLTAKQRLPGQAAVEESKVEARRAVEKSKVEGRKRMKESKVEGRNAKRQTRSRASTLFSRSTALFNLRRSAFGSTRALPLTRFPTAVLCRAPAGGARMPELPEVEIERRSLERWFRKRRIVSAVAEKTRSFRGADRKAFESLR